jgi:hypothetical protein
MKNTQAAREEGLPSFALKNLANTSEFRRINQAEEQKF